MHSPDNNMQNVVVNAKNYVTQNHTLEILGKKMREFYMELNTYKR
jgi:hypothetical protein